MAPVRRSQGLRKPSLRVIRNSVTVKVQYGSQTYSSDGTTVTTTFPGVNSLIGPSNTPVNTSNQLDVDMWLPVPLNVAASNTREPEAVEVQQGGDQSKTAELKIGNLTLRLPVPLNVAASNTREPEAAEVQQGGDQSKTTESEIGNLALRLPVPLNVAASNTPEPEAVEVQQDGDQSKTAESKPGNFALGHFNKVKMKTLQYALEICDKTLLISIMSEKIDLDREAGLELLNTIKRSKEIYKDCMTPLQCAVSLGFFKICQQLVKEGALLISKCSNIPHPLCIALEREHYGIAHFLIGVGADVNLAFDKRFPICYALAPQHCPVDLVKRIVDAGFPVNKVASYHTGETALHLAVAKSRVDVVKYLVSSSVDLDVKDKMGLVPLHYAVQHDNIEIVKMLVQGGAMIDYLSMDSFTPLFYAISHGNYEIVNLLVTLGADIHYVSENMRCSMTPLHFAANICHLKITQLLLEKGADPNQTVPLTGETALHSASRATAESSQKDSVVELLIKKGSNLELRNKFGYTPLQLALKSENVSVAKLLVISGANIKSTVTECGDRRSTFRLAANILDSSLIKLFLDYGADYMSEDSDGIYPCQSVIVNSITYTLSHRTECTHIRHSCEEINAEFDLTLLKIFWRHGFPFDLTLDLKWLTSSHPAFPACIAAVILKQKMLFNGVKAQNLRMVQRAISQGADVRFCSKNMQNPLHFIAARGDEHILKEFVTRGVCTNVLNKKGESALHIAAREGHVNCCRLLLEHGAVYNYAGQKLKKTPLQLAKLSNRTAVVTLLTSVDKYFKELKEGSFKKLKPDMKIFFAVINCVHRDGSTLLGRACRLNWESANRLMRIKLHMV